MSPPKETILEKLYNVKGKTIVLTGASGYLAVELSLHLYHLGAQVIGLDKDKSTSGQYYKFFQVDFNSPEFPKVLERITKEEEHLDVLINMAWDLSYNTGFNIPGAEKYTYEHWYRNFMCMYWAVLTTTYIGEMMKQEGDGSIINIGTMYAKTCPDPNMYIGTRFRNPPAYSAMKAALAMYTKRCAVDLGVYGVRCNVVHPGAFPKVKSKANGNAVDLDHDQDFLNRLERKSPLNITGHPADLVGLIVFLCSDCSSYLTGQEISVDGGWDIW